jgi:hypothetical protein
MYRDGFDPVCAPGETAETLARDYGIRAASRIPGRANPAAV